MTSAASPSCCDLVSSAGACSIHVGEAAGVTVFTVILNMLRDRCCTTRYVRNKDVLYFATVFGVALTFLFLLHRL